MGRGYGYCRRTFRGRVLISGVHFHGGRDWRSGVGTSREVDNRAKETPLNLINVMPYWLKTKKREKKEYWRYSRAKYLYLTSTLPKPRFKTRYLKALPLKSER